MKSKSSQPFSIIDLVRTSWRSLLASPGLLLGASALYLAFITRDPVLGWGYTNVANAGMIALWAVFAVFVTGVLSIILLAGLIRIFLMHHDGDKPSLAELFRNRRLFWKFLFTEVMVALITITVFLISLIVLTILGIIVGSAGFVFSQNALAVFVLIGLTLSVIPSILISIKLNFAGYISIDKEMGPSEAIAESWRITRNRKWLIFRMILAIAAINIVASFANLGGLLVSLSLTLMIQIGAYRALLHHPENRSGSAE